MIPCVIFEDDHLLVVKKPAGWNTHAPSPYAGEGIYDWLKHREPCWATLAILHRLDKDTSGIIVFGKTSLANRALTQQLAERKVRKKYALLTDRKLKQREMMVRTKLVRVGDRYASGALGEMAETRFRVVDAEFDGRSLIEASPLTGRTHQIRVHAAENGFPVLGDGLYGGSPFSRVCLHATEISFQHPETNETVTFQSPPDFDTDTRLALRQAIIEPEATDAFRVIHGASDNRPGWYVDRLGQFLLSQGEQTPDEGQQAWLETYAGRPSGVGALEAPVAGVYHKTLSRNLRGTSVTESSPRLIQGNPAPERFTIRENGVKFEAGFNEGYSVGLFLDQRDNRRRFLTGYVAAGFPLVRTGASLSEARQRTGSFDVLNTFAYTCGFSVCAALRGARTTSLDLSKKYLEWGKRNFALNGLNPADHDFIYGDTFDWLKRLAKKGRTFDVVVLDPPTFSQSKISGAFRAEKDYGKLVSSALPVLKKGGVLLASTNAADWLPEDFLARVMQAIEKAGRKIERQHYAPQPPDFPISRSEPGYLKSVWLQIG